MRLVDLWYILYCKKYQIIHKSTPSSRKELIIMDRYSNILLTLSLLGGEAVNLTVVYINNKIPRYKSLNY